MKLKPILDLIIPPFFLSDTFDTVRVLPRSEVLAELPDHLLDVVMSKPNYARARNLVLKYVDGEIKQVAPAPVLRAPEPWTIRARVLDVCYRNALALHCDIVAKPYYYVAVLTRKKVGTAVVLKVYWFGYWYLQAYAVAPFVREGLATPFAMVAIQPSVRFEKVEKAIAAIAEEAAKVEIVEQAVERETPPTLSAIERRLMRSTRKSRWVADRILSVYKHFGRYYGWNDLVLGHSMNVVAHEASAPSIAIALYNNALHVVRGEH